MNNEDSMGEKVKYQDGLSVRKGFGDTMSYANVTGNTNPYRSPDKLLEFNIENEDVLNRFKRA